MLGWVRDNPLDWETLWDYRTLLLVLSGRERERGGDTQMVVMEIGLTDWTTD